MHTCDLDLVYSKLEPRLAGPECQKLLQTSLLSVMSLSLEGGTKKGKEETYQELEQLEEALGETVGALQALLREILIKDCSPDGLLNIVEVCQICTIQPSLCGPKCNVCLGFTSLIIKLYGTQLLSTTS